MNKRKKHISSIAFKTLTVLLVCLLNCSMQAHSFALENGKQTEQSELTTQKFISGDGLLVTPIKITERNTVNFQYNCKQNFYTDRYSSASHLQLQIAYAQYFSLRQNNLFAPPIYIAFRSLLI